MIPRTTAVKTTQKMPEFCHTTAISNFVQQFRPVGTEDMTPTNRVHGSSTPGRANSRAAIDEVVQLKLGEDEYKEIMIQILPLSHVRGHASCVGLGARVCRIAVDSRANGTRHVLKVS